MGNQEEFARIEVACLMTRGSDIDGNYTLAEYLSYFGTSNVRKNSSSREKQRTVLSQRPAAVWFDLIEELITRSTHARWCCRPQTLLSGIAQ
jgi:hypothetical protein